MAVADVTLDRTATTSGRLGLSPAWIPRLVAWGLLGFVVVVLPNHIANYHATRWTLAIVYAIVALSLNVLIGYAGQVSLGHQGFFGLGAFVSGYMVSGQGQVFWTGLVIAAVVVALASLLMGMVALRVRGLYLALVTLVFGLMAERSIFTWPLFGEGAGVEAPRPGGFEAPARYYLLCVAALVVVWYLDWRFTKSKAGRAVAALRENEQVASSYAIPVARYKLLAFVLSGIFVGVAGSLYGHYNTTVSPQPFQFQLALFFIIVTVVGGLRSRPGIVLWTVVFTLAPQYLGDLSDNAPFIGNFIGTIILLLVLVYRPGGIGQIIRPITSWMSGGPFKTGDDDVFVEEGVRGRP
jgi:branched-chain amino acid transport system permease protein